MAERGSRNALCKGSFQEVAVLAVSRCRALAQDVEGPASDVLMLAQDFQLPDELRQWPVAYTNDTRKGISLDKRLTNIIIMMKALIICASGYEHGWGTVGQFKEFMATVRATVDDLETIDFPDLVA